MSFTLSIAPAKKEEEAEEEEEEEEKEYEEKNFAIHGPEGTNREEMLHNFLVHGGTNWHGGWLHIFKIYICFCATIALSEMKRCSKSTCYCFVFPFHSIR